MLEFTVSQKDDGRKLVRLILLNNPQLGAGAVYKALRRKDVLVNDQRIRHDIPLRSGDRVRVYIPDRELEKPLLPTVKPYKIIFADHNYLILNKSPHIMVQPGRDVAGSKKEPSLIELIRTELEDPEIRLCHRLDRQTSGLIILARGLNAWQSMQKCMRQDAVIKRYQCLVVGVPQSGEQIITHDGNEFFGLQAWLEKDAIHKMVYMHEQKQTGDKNVVTLYRLLQIYSDVGTGGEPVSHLEVELHTGRTHQIRAHLASIGHPILGDGKYGLNRINRLFQGKSGGLKRQQLCATSLTFTCSSGFLQSDIGGRTFSIPPDFDWPQFKDD